MDQATLAQNSQVSRNTIVSFESGQRIPGANNLATIQETLEAAGVEFPSGGVTWQPGLEGGRVEVVPHEGVRYVLLRTRGACVRLLSAEQALTEAQSARVRGENVLAFLLERAAATLHGPA